jgi:hypothetical protein
MSSCSTGRGQRRRSSRGRDQRGRSTWIWLAVNEAPSIRRFPFPFPRGSKGGKGETPPPRPAAAQFRSLVSGQAPKNRRIRLKYPSFQLFWGVSVPGSGRYGASWVKLGPKIFRHPARRWQINRPRPRQVKFRFIRRDGQLTFGRISSCCKSRCPFRASPERPQCGSGRAVPGLES